MLPYSWDDIFYWVEPVKPFKKPLQPISSVAVDSRAVQKNSLFVALPGAKTDGHLFLQEVRAQGAQAALVNKEYSGPNYGLELVFVNDTLQALQSAGKGALERSKARRIGITGSLGKTSTKNFLKTILETKYRVYASSGNKNSQIGLALSILNEFRGDEDICIFEMAMTHPGQIAKLVSIAPPDIALITWIALVHAENFDTLYDIARAKAEILTSSRTKHLFLPYDNECFSFLQSIAHIGTTSYSTKNSEGDWFLNGFTMQYQGHYFDLPPINLLAHHMYNNLAGAIAVAHHVGMEFGEIQQAISHISHTERRLEIVEKKGVCFLNDCYNAAEPSIKGALQAMAEQKGYARKIAVLGYMPQLGKFSKECHQNVGTFALDKVDRMFCFGQECAPIVDVWEKENREVFLYTEFEMLLKALRCAITEGDLVLVKGARVCELERILEQW